jgi:ketosteroid isomerase-like protein
MSDAAPHAIVVIDFMDTINHGDVERLLSLMTDGHVMRVLDEPPVRGKDALRNAWRGYFAAFPRYRVYVDRIAVEGDRVAVLGHTTGSHLGLPDEEESQLSVIWTADVRDERVASWNILEDSPQTRRELGLT